MERWRWRTEETRGGAESSRLVKGTLARIQLTGLGLS